MKSSCTKTTTAAISVLMLIPLFFGGCAGYRVGTRSLYNDTIKTVYVPMFESDSYRRNTAERLTEAVCKRVEQRTPYKVVSRPHAADSILTGRLLDEVQSVASANEYDDVRQKRMHHQVEVLWVDRRGLNLRNPQHHPWGINAADITTNWAFVPEMGDSTVLAQQKAIDRMADQIVEMMQQPW